MHLLTVSGFLGTGKTTFIIQLAEAAMERGVRTAVLVNEIGQIGIDDQLMRHLDLNVYKLLNGCICCALAADLPATLKKLAEDYAPDLILLEPSGVADLKNVLTALTHYSGEPLSSCRSAVIVDPLRLPILIQALTPLITSQIENADLVLFNKIDLASEQDMAQSAAVVDEISPGKQRFAMSAKSGLEPALVEAVLP